MIWVYMKSPVMQQGCSSPVYATQPSIQTYLILIAYPIYCENMAKNPRIDEISAKDLMVTKIQTVDCDGLLSEAIGKMSEQVFHEIPVLDSDGRYMGLVSLDSIIKRRNLPLTARVRNLLSIPPEATEDDNLSALAEKMLISGVRTLPVLSENRLVGIVSRTDIVQALSSVKELKDVSVDSIMSHYPLSVKERDGIGTAKSLIRELHEQIIPVVDDSGRLTGVVGIKDIAPYLWGVKTLAKDGWSNGKSYPPNIEIKSVMHRPITVPLGTSVGNAAQLMSEHSITSVIVVEGNKPVGVVTQLNLIELIASAKKREEVYVQITGLSEESSFQFDSIYTIIQKSLQRIAKVTVPTFFSMHVAQYNIETGASKYSIRIILKASKKSFYAKAHDWNLMKATDDVMNVLEKMVRKDKEKKRDKDRDTKRN
jgi:CBS domain-containing protein